MSNKKGRRNFCKFFLCNAAWKKKKLGFCIQYIHSQHKVKLKCFVNYSKSCCKTWNLLILWMSVKEDWPTQTHRTQDRKRFTVIISNYTCFNWKFNWINCFGREFTPCSCKKELKIQLKIVQHEFFIHNSV